MMRGLVIALVATAALAGCSKKEEVQIPPTETTIVTPAPVVVPTPAPATGDTTVVTPPATETTSPSTGNGGLVNDGEKTEVVR